MNAASLRRSGRTGLDLRSILMKFSFFRQAPPPLRREMLQAALHIKAGSGTCLFNAGDTCARFALVGAGRIRVYKIAETGRQVTLYNVVAGQTCIVNTLCSLLSTRAVATAIVEDPIEAVTFAPQRFLSWMRAHDLVRNFIVEMMAERLIEVMELVEEIAFRKVDQRLSEFLLLRFKTGRTAARTLALTHAAIAAELGTAREVVSRLLKEFERQGAVRMTRGRLYLQNEGQLLKIAGAGSTEAKMLEFRFDDDPVP